MNIIAKINHPILFGHYLLQLCHKYHLISLKQAFVPSISYEDKFQIESMNVFFISATCNR